MRHRRVVPIVLWIGGLLVSALIVSRTPFVGDMSAFLPRSADARQQVLVDQLREGAVSRLILLAIEGAPPATLAALSKELAERLRGAPSLSLVSNGEDRLFGRDREFLWHNRYLLSPGVTSPRFTATGLREALEEDLRLLASPIGLLLKRVLPQDPTGEMLHLVEDMQGVGGPARRDGVWFSPNLSRALLMVQTEAAGFDIDRQEAALALIRDAFAQARGTVPGGSATELITSGPAVFAVESRAQMKSDASRFSLIATVLVATVLIIAYRSPLLVGLSLLPVATGALAGVAAVSLGFGFVHGITLGFGVTLIGEAVDYGVYLFTQTAPDSSPDTTLRRIWPTLRLGLLTSVFGYGAMLLSGFPGFVQLGLFIITGLIVAAAVTRWVLPRLTPQGFTGVHAGDLASVLYGHMRRAPRLRVVLALTVAGAVLTLGLHRGGYWEDEIASLSPVPTALQQRDQMLRRELGAPDVRYMVMVTVADEQQAIRKSERIGATLNLLVSEGVLSSFDAPYRYLPSVVTQRSRQAALPGDDDLQTRLAEAVQGLPFRAALFDPFRADVARARAQAPITRASLKDTALAAKLDSLLLARDDQSVAILPLQGVTDAARINAAVQALGAMDVELLDLKQESDLLLATYLGEAQTLGLFGSIAIAILLAASLKSLHRLGAVLPPLAAAVIVTAAILIFGGQQLSIFHLFGLLLVVAVGSNYCLFFVRDEVRSADGARIVTSVVLANLCTVMAFGVLSFSPIPVLQSIGSTVAIGTFLSLIFAAILTSWGVAGWRELTR